MGTEDLGCGPTMPQVRFSPNLEQGERKERGEIALKYLGGREDYFYSTERQGQVAPMFGESGQE